MRAGNTGDAYVSFIMNSEFKEGTEMQVGIFLHSKNEPMRAIYRYIHYRQPFKICSEDDVNEGHCTKDLVGQYIRDPDETWPEKYASCKLTSPNKTSCQLEIEDDGIYCVTADTYTGKPYVCGEAHFHSFFGEMTVTQFRLMKAYGLLAVGYTMVTVLYACMLLNSRSFGTRLHRQRVYLLIIRTIDSILQWHFYRCVDPSFVHKYTVEMFAVISETFLLYQFAFFIKGNNVGLKSKIVERSLQLVLYLAPVIAIVPAYKWSGDLELPLILSFSIHVLQFTSWLVALGMLKSSVSHLKTSDPHSELTRVRILRYVLVIGPSILFITITFGFVSIILFHDCYSLKLPDGDSILEATTPIMAAQLEFVVITCILYLWRP